MSDELEYFFSLIYGLKEEEEGATFFLKLFYGKGYIFFIKKFSTIKDMIKEIKEKRKKNGCNIAHATGILKGNKMEFAVFWIDYDCEDPEYYLWNKASIIVNSGKGFHFYFLLDRRIDWETALKLQIVFRKRLKDKISKRIFILNNLHPLSFMRTPSTINWKYNTVVKIEKMEEKFFNPLKLAFHI